MSNQEFPVQGYYVFNSGNKIDSIKGFEEATGLRVDRGSVVTIPIGELEEIRQPKHNRSWWNSFWEDGWSHLTFGTVATVFGVGLLVLASGPVGWTTAAVALSSTLSIGGGAVGAYAGVRQLTSHDPQIQQRYARVGDIALSIDNIPGLLAGATTYVVTEQNIDQSITNANIAGLVVGGAAFIRSSGRAVRGMRQFALETSHLKRTNWTSTMRKYNARVAGIDPKGLEGSHLIPQRVVKKVVAKVPLKIRRPVELFFNGPFCITFMTDIQHALVDSYRYKSIEKAKKEILAHTNPIIAPLLEHYPALADGLGFSRNLSPMARPVVSSLVITSGRTTKLGATQSSRR